MSCVNMEANIFLSSESIGHLRGGAFGEYRVSQTRLKTRSIHPLYFVLIEQLSVDNSQQIA